MSLLTELGRGARQSVYKDFAPTALPIDASAKRWNLQLAGAAGRSYIISATTNLSSPQWVGLVTNPVSAGVLDFDDTSAAAFPSRFYRASVAP